jgi:hypothetical protein
MHKLMSETTMWGGTFSKVISEVGFIQDTVQNVWFATSTDLGETAHHFEFGNQ